jgi:hypothetical protein
MSTIAAGDDLGVVAGVDTHKDVHVAVVLDEVGRLGTRRRSQPRLAATGT